MDIDLLTFIHIKWYSYRFYFPLIPHINTDSNKNNAKRMRETNRKHACMHTSIEYSGKRYARLHVFKSIVCKQSTRIK